MQCVCVCAMMNAAKGTSTILGLVFLGFPASAEPQYNLINVARRLTGARLIDFI